MRTFPAFLLHSLLVCGSHRLPISFNFLLTLTDMSDSPTLPVDKLCTQNTSHPLIEFPSPSLWSIFAQFCGNMCLFIYTIVLTMEEGPRKPFSCYQGELLEFKGESSDSSGHKSLEFAFLTRPNWSINNFLKVKPLYRFS